MILVDDPDETIDCPPGACCGCGADLATRYRALGTAGLAASLYRRTATAKDARRLARRFLGFEDRLANSYGAGAGPA